MTELSRTQLVEDLLNLAMKLHWKDLRPGEDPECLEICQQIVDKVEEYQSLVRHEMWERGEPWTPPSP